MAGFLYYLPGLDPGRAPAVDLETVRRFGLEYAFDSRPTPSGVHRNGPDGRQGVIVADAGRVPKIGWYPDRQKFRPVPGSEALVVWYEDQRPGPEDLVRSEVAAGHLVRLCDGNDWMVPIARGWSHHNGAAFVWYCGLPRRMDVDEAGNWVEGDPLPRYAGLWQMALAYWDRKQRALNQADDEQPDETAGIRTAFDFADFGGASDAAVEALGFNYRLGKAEVGALGLFDTTSAVRVLDALVDFPGLLALLAKKASEATGAAAGSSGDVGPAASTPATVPASPTSSPGSGASDPNPLTP